ncbi:hypothetical protein TcCL_NonESM10197 [Trypanosoma cruzi]|nr:hypothetical protein TcCL_NonESM10197 [Trypanosoma cruzi]
MHRRRDRLRVDRGTQILVIMEACMAFVLCGFTETNVPPQRCWIGGRVDRSNLLRYADAKVCFTAVALQYFHIMEVSGDKHGRIDTSQCSDTPWTYLIKKDCMV